MLEPLDAVAGCNIDEWKSRMETFIGVTYPGLKRLFTTEDEGPNGQRHFATPMEDLEIVHPQTLLTSPRDFMKIPGSQSELGVTAALRS